MESIEFVFVLLMVLVNAVFAGYEIALASISVSRLQFLSSQDRPGAASALYMKLEIEKSLAVVQLGITMVGLIAGATGGASAQDDIAPLLAQLGLRPALANVFAILLVVLPLTAITIVIGELVPKLFALRNKEWVCLVLSSPMKWFAMSVWPVVWVLETSASKLMDLSESLWRPSPHADARTEAAELQELRAITSLARTSRLIGAREENIILGAARLASRQLVEIVLPVEHIRTLHADSTLADSLLIAHTDMHTRFPVVENKGDPQSIIGYVTFKDIVSMMKLSLGVPTLRGILRPIPHLSDRLPISEALEKLLRQHTHIALVCGDSGVVQGMITLEDIVEEMIGDIQDEYDMLPTHLVRSGSGWVAGGGVSLVTLKDMTGIDLAKEATNLNLSAWTISEIGRDVEGGEIIRHGTIQIQVRKVRRKRVLEAALNVIGNAVS